jgi:hypothetical protein
MAPPRPVLTRRFRCSFCRYVTYWFDYHETGEAGHVMLDHIESEHPSEFEKTRNARDVEGQLYKMFYYELPDGNTVWIHPS